MGAHFPMMGSRRARTTDERECPFGCCRTVLKNEKGSRRAQRARERRRWRTEDWG